MSERDGLTVFLDRASHPVLSREEERRLAVRKDAGDKDAFDQLVLHNVKLVYTLARRQYRPTLSVTLDDLVQYGMLGLIHAVEKYDYRKGFKLSTYATWWIRQAMDRAVINYEQPVRVPMHNVAAIRRMVKAEQKLQGSLGREPTDAELAAEARLTVAKLNELRVVDRSVLSLDWEREDGSTVDMADSVDVEGDQVLSDLAVRAHEALDHLTERERRVIMLRYGLGEHEPHTLEAVSETLGVTRSRVQQIQTGALEKLRNLMGVAA